MSHCEGMPPAMGSKKKRQMMFVPEVNPSSFVFFFEKGDTGFSWSIRDYSGGKGPPKECGRREFPWMADQVREKAKYSFDAPAVDTNETDYWHERTLEYNRAYLGLTVESTPVSRAETAERSRPVGAKEIIDQVLGASRKIHNKQQLAEAAKVSPSTISRMATGHYEARKETRVAVAEVINKESAVNEEIQPCIPDDLLPPPHLLNASETK